MTWWNNDLMTKITLMTKWCRWPLWPTWPYRYPRWPIWHMTHDLDDLTWWHDEGSFADDWPYGIFNIIHTSAKVYKQIKHLPSEATRRPLNFNLEGNSMPEILYTSIQAWNLEYVKLKKQWMRCSVPVSHSRYLLCTVARGQPPWPVPTVL